MSWLRSMQQPNAVPIQRGGWLDFLRLAVAVLIVLHHFQAAAPTPLASFHPVFARGYLLTDFFLIDSGYVLARIYAQRVGVGEISIAAFLRKRFLRVVPSHLLMMAALAALVLLAGAWGVSPTHPEWFDWREYPSQLFLVQAFGVPGGHGWNAPTWSLSALLGCYVLFAFGSRRFIHLSGWTAVGVAIGFFALASWATWSFLGYPVYQMPLTLGFVRAVPLFLLGMAMARFSDTVPVRETLAKGVGVAAFLALIVLQFFGRNSLLTLAMISLMIIAAGAIPVRNPSPSVTLGALAAFSMFVTNEVVRIGWFGVSESLVRALDLPVATQWGLWGLGLFVAIGFAFAFYRFVDAPSQRWLNAGKQDRWFGARRPPSVPKAVAISD